MARLSRLDARVLFCGVPSEINEKGKIYELEADYIYAKTAEQKDSIKSELMPLYSRFGYPCQKAIWEF